MSTPYAVRVENLAKSYIIAHEHRPTTLGEAISKQISSPRKRRTKEEFWALNDISFNIGQGEVVGIIGRNGAGKSTLLKILSRIVSPTKGHIEMRGRVGSLLEVGTGFHPELTGRENIFLNGSILGMRHREIEGHFDAIVDFAGVEQFLDTPVKRYSSGMYVRLAFAVAAHLRSDILIIDEVLAVGDAEFQKKCLGKMQSIANGEGRTILFVSHNMTSVRALCQRCVLLSKGYVAFDGACEEATEHYLAQLKGEANPQGGDASSVHIPGEYDLAVHDNPYGKDMLIQKVLLRNQAGALTNQVKMGEPFSVEVIVKNSDEFLDPSVLLMFKTPDGTLLSSIGTNMQQPRSQSGRAATECYQFHITSLPVIPNTYEIDVLLRNGPKGRFVKIDRVASLIQLKIQSADVMQSGYEFSRQDGQIYLQASWERLPHG
jgi:lipopolysaccharide transport system ATP-binding protein